MTTNWSEVTSGSIYDDLMKLVESVSASTGPTTPCYFARKWELKAAIKFFKDCHVIVCDDKGNRWYHGEKLRKDECDERV